MANQQLLEYVKAQTAAGVSKADIRAALAKVNWPAPDIEAAIAAAEGKPVAAPTMPPIAAKPPVQLQPQVQVQPQEKPLPVIHMHPPGGMLRSPWLWTVVFALVLAALAAGAYFLTPVGSIIKEYFAPAPVVVPIATTTPPVIEQTYTDPTYGFSVTYPSDLLRIQNGADEVFALTNFSAAATTSLKAVAACVTTNPSTATTTINGSEFVIRAATSTASTTIQTYSTVHVGACITLRVSDISAGPILLSFNLIATSTPPFASTTVQQ